MPHKRLQYELNLWKQDVGIIAGVDEAGRGPLAGPLVAAAVILNKDHLLNKTTYEIKEGSKDNRNNDVGSEIKGGKNKNSELLEIYRKIKDSKKLTEKSRNNLFTFIKKHSVAYSIVEISPEEIDRWGIGRANEIAFTRVVKNLNTKPHHVLSDYYKVKGWHHKKQSNIKGGDDKSLTIASASILAKVYRDEIMVNMHKKYPKYKFHKHKGYGTKYHREAILKHGPCEIHRKSYEPTKSYFLKNKS